MRDGAPTPRQVAQRSRTDEKITEAVLGIAREDGLSAVTIDEVAKRSGVAKTTIYRRYADRFELLTGVASQLNPVELRDHMVSREGLVEQLEELQHLFEDRLGLGMIGRLLGSTESFMREWRNRVISPHISAMTEYFDRGIRKGVFVDGVDYALIVEMMIGAMIMRDTLAGDVPDDWAARTVDTLWPLIGATDRL